MRLLIAYIVGFSVFSFVYFTTPTDFTSAAAIAIAIGAVIDDLENGASIMFALMIAQDTGYNPLPEYGLWGELVVLMASAACGSAWYHWLTEAPHPPKKDKDGKTILLDNTVATTWR